MKCGDEMTYVGVVVVCEEPKGHPAEVDHRGPLPSGFHLSWPWAAFDREHREDPLTGMHYRIVNGRREVVDSPYKCEVCKP